MTSSTPFGLLHLKHRLFGRLKKRHEANFREYCDAYRFLRVKLCIRHFTHFNPSTPLRRSTYKRFPSFSPK
uniref:Uncharacterized protein n=1 Tax=Caenorhabditis tropicalis TaxID=1561998 RepID=A0A1I7TLT9_9PELO